MADDIACTLAGEPVVLLGVRALYRPQRRALLIADLHLGKGDVFRRAGIALPDGGTGHDLERLDALLATHATDTLWILGDVLHGPAPRAGWQKNWLQWRARHPSLRIAALRGNHDRQLSADGLGIDDAGTAIEDGPFVLRHDPLPHPTLHVLCGHLHPQVRLAGMQRRWPAFWLRSGITVLPAFSHFTAGVVPMLAAGDRLVACVEGAAIALPSG